MAHGNLPKKIWGREEFPGLGFEWDPQWHLTPEQQKLQADLIQLCHSTLRPNAVVFDATYEFPRRNFEAIAKLGLLGLTVPKEFGGLGQNHRCAVMICETIARYGCGSTAMCYVMHLGAVAALLFRHHNNPRAQDLLRRLDKEVLVGTLSYSDPATGGHFWFPMSSKVAPEGDGFHILKMSSWTTSAGFADWYVVQCTSAEFGGNYSNLSCFLAFKDELRSDIFDWSALGLHGGFTVGNQSGPMIVDQVVPKDRLIGPSGDGVASNDEIVDPWFLLMSGGVWNGLSLGCIDIAKKHTTQKRHADVGMRVCDYPTIQDYVGEAIIDTNASRAQTFSIAATLDSVTKDCDWNIHKDLTVLPRSKFLHWLWQVKFTASKNVTFVSDKMLHACGGAGYKTDLGLERLLRDAKAGWVMGPSNEILRQFVGKSALLGAESLDYWCQVPNHRIMNSELKKLSKKGKRELAHRLLKEVELEDRPAPPLQTFRDFDNPFASAPPATLATLKGADGVEHKPALTPGHPVKLVLAKRTVLAPDTYEFRFQFPDGQAHSGCLPGQYVKLIGNNKGTKLVRYFSPTSPPAQFGSIDIVTRLLARGAFSTYLLGLKEGDSLDCEGPIGGFEYRENVLDDLVLIAGGTGVTPCLQLIRTALANPKDKTRITLIYCTETEEDILYKSELDKHAQGGRLRPFYVVKDASPTWTGFQGWLDRKMLAESLNGVNVKGKTMGVLCGGPYMVITTLTFLMELSFPSQKLFVYGPTGDEQVRMVYGRNAVLADHTISPAGDAAVDHLEQPAN